MHLFLGRCGLILQLAPIFDQLWGPTDPKRLGTGEKEVGIDRPIGYEVFWRVQAPKS